MFTHMNYCILRVLFKYIFSSLTIFIGIPVSMRLNYFLSKCIPYNPADKFYIENSLTLHTILNQLTPFNTLTPSFLQIRFNIIRRWTPVYPKWSLRSRISNKNFVHISLISQVRCSSTGALTNLGAQLTEKLRFYSEQWQEYILSRIMPETDLEPIQSPLKWVPGILIRVKLPEFKTTTCLHLMLRLRMLELYLHPIHLHGLMRY